MTGSQAIDSQIKNKDNTLVAQKEESPPPKWQVVGSNPTKGAKQKKEEAMTQRNAKKETINLIFQDMIKMESLF